MLLHSSVILELPRIASVLYAFAMQPTARARARPVRENAMKLCFLPEPQEVAVIGGSLQLGEPVQILLSGKEEPAARLTVAFLQRQLHDRFQLRASLVGSRLSTRQKPGHLNLILEPHGHEQSYTLRVDSKSATVVGNGLPGLFYGCQTLLQLIRTTGTRLPCVVIRDRPTFAHRGFYLDISRGKVPKLATLKRLADQLSSIKVNQLQLYVEHVFDFAFDPAIGRGCDPLTATDIVELDRHCRELHIELVPGLACFGHMGRVLSLPKYRALAAVDWPARDWKSATWIQRLRGATLNPVDPTSRRLIEDMLTDFLPHFSSSHFNMCGDETYDLGRGRSENRASAIGVGKLYLEHVRFTRKLAARFGKQLMFWGDVMLHHPDCIGEIPKDCTVLDWGYNRDTPFEKVGRFLQAGLPAYVCPSTRGYKVVFNEVEEARANISGYARAGARLGAHGLLVTDWGDMGHFNMLPCSFHGMALGAAMGWNPSSDEQKGFDRAFSLHAFNDPSGRAARFYFSAGSTGIADWPLLISDIREAPIPAATLRKARLLKATAWRDEIRRIKAGHWITEADLAQLSLAIEALELNAEKILVESARRHGKTGADHRRRGRQFAGRLLDFSQAYARAWLRVNRPSGLAELTRAFRRAATEMDPS